MADSFTDQGRKATSCQTRDCCRIHVGTDTPRIPYSYARTNSRLCRVLSQLHFWSMETASRSGVRAVPIQNAHEIYNGGLIGQDAYEIWNAWDKDNSRQV